MSENAEAAAAELGSISISTTDDEPDVDDDDDANTRLVASVVTKMSEMKKIRIWFIVGMMILLRRWCGVVNGIVDRSSIRIHMR